MSSGENGRIADRYRIVRQLGRGGMGVVWRAVDEVLGREVAVKELRTYSDAGVPELADLRLRMTREARAAARVRHPGVVAVHDVTEHEGRPVIVMELVDGPSLDDVLAERGTIDPVEAARIGAHVLEALAAAHEVGVLHRDVKPGNILLDRSGRIVLTDFGIATMEDPGDGSATHLTRSGEIIGSLDFLAPERARGQDPGPASDVWAVGATLYAAVEGASPFRRTSTWSTLAAIVTEPLPEPRRAGPLTPILLRLLDKDPATRPGAREAAGLLGAVGAAGAAGTAPVPPVAPEGFGPPVAPAGPVAPEAVVMPEPVVSVAPTGPAVEPVVEVTPLDSAPFALSGAPAPSGVPGSLGAPAAPAAPGRRAARAAGRRRNALIAASVAAVLLAGGGLTYVLVDRDPGQRQTAGGSPADGGSGGGTGGEDGRVMDPGSPGAPSSGTASGSAKPSASTSDGASPSVGASAGPGGGGTATGGAGGDGTDPGTGADGGSGGGAAAATGGGAGSATVSGAGSSGTDTGTGTGSGSGTGSGGTGTSSSSTSGAGSTSGSGGGTASGGTTGATAPASGGTTTTAPADGGSGGSTAAPTTEAPAPSSGCESSGSSSTCQVVRSATTSRHDGGEMGTIGAGPHTFYCQVDLDHTESYGGVSSRWFARTDDDSGNTNVYFSVLHLSGGASGGPVAGLRVC
ncbi:protein kinase [Streptomyces sp. NPDC056144]|uniref:serine/threonine-protein kinase n=1 Tax=unclassified Streptomyces TaxID=2593676 RepID=UPI0035E1D8C5